jgi:uncharacterized surface protein with fasciclin (FAS1) repeats
MKQYSHFTCFSLRPVMLLVLVAALMILPSCDSDDVGGNLYTFTGQMVGQYLTDQDNDQFSEFARLLDTTKVIGLLNSYGQYTVFAPNNKAMQDYYKTKGKNSLSDFNMDSLTTIAYDHIINGTQVLYLYFINGRLSPMSMSNRYFTISFEDNANTFVNRTSLITQKDVVLHNGVIHAIDRVLDPAREGIVEAIASRPEYSLFHDALILTGMADSLLLIRDDTYNAADHRDLIQVPKDANNWMYHEIPAFRRYGYTVLMESNATMAARGVNNLEDMIAFASSVYDRLYPEHASITDYTDRRNSLNRYISYHLIAKELSKTKFIDAYDTDHMVKTVDMYEYIETMMPNTLLEVKKERSTGKSNLFNPIDAETMVELHPANFDFEADNGVFHEINKPLLYSVEVDAYLSSKRLRFDAASFFPELTNNNMRGSRWTQNSTQALYREQSLHYQIPRGYISRITASEQTVVGYLAGYARFQNYMADEIFLSASTGKLYDFTIVTPPIPAGTYEIRFGYLTNGRRGVAQLYIDDIPAGVPLNLNLDAETASGYQVPGSIATDPLGFENDKMMRNQGYMKGPAGFKVAETGWTSGQNARFSRHNLRRILGTYHFSKAGHHTFKVVGLSGGEFMFDYMEFVPTSAIEFEDIY